MKLSRHNSRIIGCALFAFAIQWVTPDNAATQGPASLVIQGGTLIDATGREPIQEQSSSSKANASKRSANAAK